MTVYEKVGKAIKYLDQKDENVLVVNNHALFHELMQEKGNVI